MQPDIKTPFQHFMTEYQTPIEEGTAFLGEPNINWQLAAYRELIGELKGFGIETTPAELGFWNLYAEIEIQSQGDPAMKAIADTDLVKLLLSDEKREEALATAHSIMALGTPEAQDEWLNAMSLRQVQNAKVEALLEIASFSITIGEAEMAYELVNEAKDAGDPFRFARVYVDLATYYRKTNQLEKLTQLSIELAQYITDYERDNADDPTTGLVMGVVKDCLELMINGEEADKKQTWSKSEFGFAGYKIDKSFKLSSKKLFGRLTAEEAEIASIVESKELQSKIAKVVVSTCQYISSREDWDKMFPILNSFLERVAEDYQNEVYKVTDEDGKVDEVITGRQGNWSSVIVTSGKEAPSKHYYYVTKMELAYVAAKMGDAANLLAILQNHFSLADIVHLYKRVDFQALQAT